MKYEIVLGFGSNLGDRLANINKAISLCSFIDLIKVSEFMETEALLPENSPSSWDLPYLNCAISGRTKFSPDGVFSRLKEIEKEMGRDLQSPRWSPRIIDIDILFYDIITIHVKTLTIPHPQVFNRTFALNPAKECAPNLIKHFLNR